MISKSKIFSSTRRAQQKQSDDGKSQIMPFWLQATEATDHSCENEQKTESEVEFSENSLSDNENEISDHDTDTEQSCGDETNEEEVPGSAVVYLGKDNTKWSAQPPETDVRTEKHKMTCLPGVKQIAKSATSIIGCWKLFFPDNMIEEIVNCTNICLNKMRERYSRERNCRDTSLEEINAVLGLLYLAGVKRENQANLEEMFIDDGTAPDCFRATMSKRRFCLLLRALRFDNIEDQENRKKVDNLAPIRHIFEEFVIRCKSNYEIGEYATVDEMLEGFRGRCKFRQYMANKSSMYGIKVYALVDSGTFYTSNLEIYAGKQPEGPFRIDNSASNVVERLISPIMNTGRNVTMDNYFTSIPLAEKLLKKNTTIVGTLSKNKKEIPPQFINTINRNQRSSIFAFSSTGTLVSYVPKRGKNILLFSSMHNDDKIDENSGDLLQPEIITFYNKTKRGVDLVDELKNEYSVSKISNRWPLTLFFSIMSIGGINSQIIYTANTDKHMPRKAFLKSLALELMKPHLLFRQSISTLPGTLRSTISRITGVESTCGVKRKAGGLRFCAFCPRRKNRKTKKDCVSCDTPICSEHTSYVCPECSVDNSDF